MTTKITEQNISQLANAGVNWQPVVTADGSTGLTAVAGRGYFIDTTSGAQTVTLPASPKVGDVVVLKDYARTWATNAVSIASNTLDGVGSATPSFSTNGQTVTLVYMDGTKGWSLINEDTTSDLGTAYITATGGTITTSGDFKIHTFTGDDCFVVSQTGSGTGPSVVDYLVVAGGGGGGSGQEGSSISGAGGGAGGFRVSNSYSLPAPTTSPLANPTGITISATTYPITVGGGGACAAKTFGAAIPGGSGSNSIFATITSTGGGGGGGRGCGPTQTGLNGGSGGGSAGVCNIAGGSGNTPPVSPPQGNNGGTSAVSPGTGNMSGGGGGAGAAGGVGTPGPSLGGVGSYVSPSFAVGCAGTPGPVGSTRYFAGGGGVGQTPAVPVTAGGSGGGGSGGTPGSGGVSGTANTGGGAGGGTAGPLGGISGAGGSGIVVIRYKFQ